jgi:hypothetical protein
MFNWVLYAAVLYCLFSPPKWDIAILWKERQEKWPKEWKQK